MCQNLAWQLCAAKGMLPGQDGAHIHFAQSPRELQLVKLLFLETMMP